LHLRFFYTKNQDEGEKTMTEIITYNLLSPAVLFFALGLIAAFFKSDLKFPSALSDTLSIYLLIAIGLKGGMELGKYSFDAIAAPLVGTLIIGVLTPILAFLICKLFKIDNSNAIALAATYGSVSIVTFGAMQSFMQEAGIAYESFMTAMVVVLESPAILISMIMYAWTKQKTMHIHPSVIKESIFGKSILLMLGGLIVGLVSGESAVPMIKPLFVDLYKSVLILFLLGMGIMAGERLADVKKVGAKLIAIAIITPVLFGVVGVIVGYLCGLSIGGTAIMGILAASASYIAAPAAIRQSIPEANPSIYLGASLGLTFPFNLIVGIPLCITLSQWIHG
jgi:hypothetical protein